MSFLQIWDTVSQALEPISQDGRVWLGLAIFFLIAFFITMREFTAWYLKINGVKREINQLNEQLLKLTAEIKQLKNSHTSQKVETVQSIEAQNPTSSAKNPTFTLHH